MYMYMYVHISTYMYMYLSIYTGRTTFSNCSKSYDSSCASKAVSSRHADGSQTSSQYCPVSLSWTHCLPLPTSTHSLSQLQLPGRHDRDTARWGPSSLPLSTNRRAIYSQYITHCATVYLTLPSLCDCVFNSFPSHRLRQREGLAPPGHTLSSLLSPRRTGSPLNPVFAPPHTRMGARLSNGDCVMYTSETPCFLRPR